jgi:hypothetical protein
MKQSKKTLISVGGGAAILIGCFLPAVYQPGMGTLSYIEGNNGKLIAFISCLIILLALLERFGWAALCGLIAGITAAEGFDETLARINHPPVGIFDNFFPGATLGVAWAVMALGVMAVIVALFVPEPAWTRTTNNAHQ